MFKTLPTGVAVNGFLFRPFLAEISRAESPFAPDSAIDQAKMEIPYMNNRHNTPRLPETFGMREALAICLYSLCDLAGSFFRWIGKINQIRHSVHYNI